MSNLKEFRQEFFLTAAECNPEKEMPLSLVMTRIIEMATLHANAWGVGYAKMIESNQGWVLSRVTVEMTRYPKVNEPYSFTTWIESYNRHFSQRNMEIRDHNDEVIGYVRTIWMVIDFATRESVDISKLSYISENISGRECPIAPQGRLKTVEPSRTAAYTFGYMDCDINRHVNTVKYEIPRFAPKSILFGKIRPRICEPIRNCFPQRNTPRNHCGYPNQRHRPDGL